MATAIILYGGKVKQETNLSEVTFHNKSGFVTSFKFNNKKYTHTFSITNQDGDQITAGYYEETQFLNYVATVLSLKNLGAYILPLNNIPDAVKGDTIKVSKLLVVDPYDSFCKINSYTWTYDPAISVYDIITDSIIIPASYNTAIVDVPLSETAYLFYYRNISFITSSDFPDNKDNAAYTLALTAIEIYRINKDIFPLFSSSSQLSTYITAQNNEWETGTLFNQPTYEDFLQYEESIVNYYNAAYANQLAIAKALEPIKLLWLAYVLSASGLAVLPIDLKLQILQQTLDVMITYTINYDPYSPGDFIAGKGGEIIAKIVDSVTVTPTQTDYFLNQILNIQYTDNSKNITLFEALYKHLGDNQAGRLTHNLITSVDYRNQYIESLYNIWKISKYYPRYNSPDYTQPPHNGVYPESFFISNKNTYYNTLTAPNPIVYKSISTDLSIYSVTFEYELNSTQVKVNEIVQDTILDEHASTETTTSLYGTYHLYQPLSLVGYTIDKTKVHIPQTNCIPAFYLYYSYDEKKKADADFLIRTIVEIALNFTLLGEVEDLVYLEELSDIANVDTIPQSTPVLSWGEVLNISRSVQFTAGSFSAISNFIIDTSENPNEDVKAFLQKLDIFLGLVTLAALSVDAISQIAIVASARDVLTDADNLGESLNFPESAKEEIEFIADIEELVTLMNNKLDGVSIVGSNTIKAKFGAFTPQDQLDFFNDFYFIDDSSPKWQTLNDEYTPGRTLVDDWEEIKDLKKFRSNVEFLNSYRFIRSDTKLVDHIIKGEITPSNKIKGIHSIIAENYGARIDATVAAKDVDGIYKTNLSKLGADGNYYPKVDGKGNPVANDMFPDEWDTQRIIEEVSLAFTDKIFDSGNRWKARMSNGRYCILCISGNPNTFDTSTRIITAWPIR